MSTLDKINGELLKLQEDLGKLNHYTDEIGKAQGASTAVVTMSQEFLASFKIKVEAINLMMEDAATSFKKRTTESSETLEEASKAFQKGIGDAKRTLSDVGAELSIVAEKVNSLALQIESINILGQFEKVNEGILKLREENTNSFNSIVSRTGELDLKILKLTKKTNLIINVLIVGMVILVVLGVLGFLKR